MFSYPDPAKRASGRIYRIKFGLLKYTCSWKAWRQCFVCSSFKTLGTEGCLSVDMMHQLKLLILAKESRLSCVVWFYKPPHGVRGRKILFKYSESRIVHVILTTKNRPSSSYDINQTMVATVEAMHHLFYNFLHTMPTWQLVWKLSLKLVKKYFTRMYFAKTFKAGFKLCIAESVFLAHIVIGKDVWDEQFNCCNFVHHVFPSLFKQFQMFCSRINSYSSWLAWFHDYNSFYRDFLKCLLSE